MKKEAKYIVNHAMNVIALIVDPDNHDGKWHTSVKEYYASLDYPIVKRVMDEVGYRMNYPHETMPEFVAQNKWYFQ